MTRFGLVIPTLVAAIFLHGCSTSAVSRFNAPATATTAIQETGGEEIRKIEELSAPALFQRAREYFARGNLSLARLHYLVALKKNPDSAAALTGFGNVEEATGELVKAQVAYELALRKVPDFLPALVALGRLHRQTGKAESSLELLQKAQAIGPGDPEILSELGVTLDRLERYAEAEPLHLQAVRQRPGTAAAHNNLGFHYLLRQRYDLALPALERALRLDPHNLVTRNNLAVVYLLRQDAERALALFRESVGEAAAWNNLGFLYMAQGNRKMAEKAFLKALDLNPQFYVTAKENLAKLAEISARR